MTERLIDTKEYELFQTGRASGYILIKRKGPLIYFWAYDQEDGIMFSQEEDILDYIGIAYLRKKVTRTVENLCRHIEGDNRDNSLLLNELPPFYPKGAIKRVLWRMARTGKYSYHEQLKPIYESYLEKYKQNE